MRRLGMMLVCGALLGVARLAAGEAPGAPEGTGAVRVAAVDVSAVFTNYRKVHDVQRQIDAAFEQERRALDDQRKRLEELAREVAKDRQQLPGDSELLFDRIQQLQKQEFLLEKKAQDLNRRIEQRYLEEMRDVLSEIRAAIRKEAERGGYQLMLRGAEADDPIFGQEAQGAPAAAVASPARQGDAAADPAQEAVREMLQPRHTLDLVARFRRNPVLFGAETVDVTQAVLKTLHEEYDRRKGAGGAVAPRSK